jgi:moderate conductance mechanosensitive channel
MGSDLVLNIPIDYFLADKLIPSFGIGVYFIVSKALWLAAIFLTAVICVWISNFIVKRIFIKQSKSLGMDKSRSVTLSAICRSTLSATIYFVAILAMLGKVFGINTATLIATAGIGGLALSFGAQSLVKDVIQGFFILIENQFYVGEKVKINEFTGFVEDLNLRITKLRGEENDLIIIPNGSITVVTNFSRGLELDAL